jgi:hypothetical protein
MLISKEKLVLVILFLSLLSTTVWSCKEDSSINAYPVALQKITGKWEPIASRSMLGGRWIADTSYNVLSFRYDGLLMNELSEPECCTPSWYIINKDTVDVTRKDRFKPNLNCELVDCAVTCQFLWMSVVRDTLILSDCGGISRKYLRYKE